MCLASGLRARLRLAVKRENVPILTGCGIMGSDSENVPMRIHTIRNRVLSFGVAIGAVAVIAAGVGLPAMATGDDGIIVQRNDQTGTTTIIVASQHGQLGWGDVFRGLASAGGLDGEALSGDFDGERLDLTQRRVCFSILALSTAIPDVSLRVIDHPVTGEPALRIRFDRDGLREKIRQVKSFVRDKFGKNVDGYGLKLDDGWDQKPADRPVVVLVHGYSVKPDSLDEFHSDLAERGWPCAMFGYPNDGPLAESGKLLAEELGRFRDRYPDRNVVIVAHSMGGLVARVAIEDPALDPGNVKQLIMVATPNHGSQWAELPGGFDCWEHLQRRPEQTILETFRAALSDGLNESRADLKPRSKFLRKLNARKRNPNVRYSIILGTGASFTAKQIAELQERLTHSLEGSRAGRLVLPRVAGFFDHLEELESGKGDWVVSVKRGRLEGVEDTLVLPITHWTISHKPTQPHHQELRDAILERLADGWDR